MRRPAGTRTLSRMAMDRTRMPRGAAIAERQAEAANKWVMAMSKHEIQMSIRLTMYHCRPTISLHSWSLI